MRQSILIILVIFSCSEPEDFDPTKGFDFCLLAGTSFTTKYGSYVFENVFDSSNRITNVFSNGIEVAKYNYEDSLVYAMFQGDSEQTITLSNNGLPIKSVDETDNLIWRIYYSEGKPLSIIVPSNVTGSPNQMYDSIVMKLDMSGNVISNEIYVYDEITQNRQFKYSKDYTYDDKINPWHGLLNGPLFSWGDYFSVNNQLSGYETYTYTYYDSGYPSSRISIGAEDFTFQYKCF